ncbi:MAG: SUF system NifU family Fe-S cluster assembly protein [Rhodospirillales bacterium]|nr:SUF system NifU family Fe-S cluster assembly protein [Rhodospirillales bacterium]
MDELRELYQEVILDHGKNPRNFGPLEDCTCQADGDNPLCGDQITVYLKLGHSGLVDDIAFEGRGCAISMASASMMTEMVQGKSEAEARALFDTFHRLVTGKEDEIDDPDDLDKLVVLAGVREFPMRIKCATLPWHTMTAAMDGRDSATTE